MDVVSVFNVPCQSSESIGDIIECAESRIREISRAFHFWRRLNIDEVDLNRRSYHVEHANRGKYTHSCSKVAVHL